MKIKHTFIIPSIGLLLLLSLSMVISLAYHSFTQIEATARERSNSSLLVNQAHDLMSSLVEAETGQRGYLLTGNQAFLKPYNSVRNSVALELTTFRRANGKMPWHWVPLILSLLLMRMLSQPMPGVLILFSIRFQPGTTTMTT